MLGSAMASLDATVVNLALPKIGLEFHASVATLQWVVVAYSLTLAAFLLPAGALGDRYGRRRIFIVGVSVFAIASGLCAAAPDAAALIGARAVQGIGASLLTPGSLAILQASFRPKDRSRAIGAWAGLGGLAAAGGPLIGGAILTVTSWRWVFLINVPLAAAVVWVSQRHVPESSASEAGRVDFVGAAGAVIFLGSLTYALIEGPGLGWTQPAVLAGIGAAALAGVAFFLAERSRPQPMLPFSLFRRRQLAATNVVTLFLYGALGGVLFLLPVTLEQADHYRPILAGCALLPITGLMVIGSPASGALSTRLGPRRQMVLGPTLAALGIGLLAHSASNPNYLTGVLPGVLVLGVGLVTVVAPLTATAMSSAPPEQVGLASAVNNDVARVAGLFAVAILPVVASLTGDAYLHPRLLAHGFAVASACGAAACLLAGVVALVGIRDHEALAKGAPPGLS